MIHLRYQYDVSFVYRRYVIKLIVFVASIFLFWNQSPHNFVIALKHWNTNHPHHPPIKNDYRSLSRLYQCRGGSSDEIPSRHSKDFRSPQSQSSQKQRSHRRNERSIYEHDWNGNRYSNDVNNKRDRKISNNSKSTKKRSRRELNPKKNLLILQAKKLIVVTGQQESDKPDNISNEFALSSTGQRNRKVSGRHRRNKTGHHYTEDSTRDNQKDIRNSSNKSSSSSKHKLKRTDDTKIDKTKNTEKHREKPPKTGRLVQNTSADSVRKLREAKSNKLKKESEISKHANVEYRPKIRSTILSSLDLLEHVNDKKVGKADNSTQSGNVIEDLQLKRDLDDGEFETLLKDLLKDDSTDDDETNEPEASDLKQESDEEVIEDEYEYEYYDTSYDMFEIPISEEITENILSSEKNMQSDNLKFGEVNDDEYYDTPNLYKNDEMNFHSRSRESHDEIGKIQDDNGPQRYFDHPSFFIDHDNAHYDSFGSDATFIDDPYEYFVYDAYDDYYDVFNDGQEEFVESLPRYRDLQPPHVSFQRGPRDNQRSYHGMNQNQFDVDADRQSDRVRRNRVAESLLFREHMTNIQNDNDMPLRRSYSDRFTHDNLREYRDNRFSRGNEYYNYNNEHDVATQANLDRFEDNENGWYNNMNGMEHEIIDHHSSENKYHDDIQIEGTRSGKMKDNLGEIHVESLGASNHAEFSKRIPPNILNPVPIVLREPLQEQYIDSESFDDELLDDDELLLLNESSNRIKPEDSDLMKPNTIKNHGKSKSGNLSMDQVLNNKLTKTKSEKVNEEITTETIKDNERLNEDDIGILESSSSESIKKKSIFSTLLGKNIFGWGLKAPTTDDDTDKFRNDDENEEINDQSSKPNQNESFDHEDLKQENMAFKHNLNKKDISNTNIDTDEAFHKKSAINHKGDGKDAIKDIIEDSVERKKLSVESVEKLERTENVETNVEYSMGFCEVIISINTYFINEEQSMHDIPSRTSPPSNNNDLESKNQPTQSSEYLAEEIPPHPGLSSYEDYESNDSVAKNHDRFIDNSQDFHTVTDNESAYVELPPPPPPPSTNEDIQTDSSIKSYHNEFNHNMEINQPPLNAEYIDNIQPPIPPPPMRAHTNLDSGNVLPIHHNQYDRTYQNNYQSSPPPPPLSDMSQAYQFDNSMSTQRNEFVHKYDSSQFHGSDDGMRSYLPPPPPPPVSSASGHFQSDDSFTTQENKSIHPLYSSHQSGTHQSTNVNKGTFT